MILHAIPYQKGILWGIIPPNIKNDDDIFYKNGDSYHFASYNSSYDKYNWCLKIVAQSPNLNLPNILYIEIEEESWIKMDAKAGDILNEILKEETPESILYTISPKVLRKLIVAGYKAASAKNYTEDDLVKLMYWTALMTDGKLNSGLTSEDLSDAIKEKIQSLQSKPVSVEIEMKQYALPGQEHLALRKGWRPLTYTKDGKTFLKVKKVNYE